MSEPPDLQRLRAAMDTINHRLVAALHERARACRSIGAWKRANGVSAIDAAREQQMLDAMLRDLPADGFSREQLAAILRAVFAASREVVQRATGET